MKLSLFVSILFLSFNSFANLNSVKVDNGNLADRTLLRDLQSKVNKDEVAMKGLNQAILDTQGNPRLLCTAGQWLMLGWINYEDRTKFLDSVNANLIEAFRLNPDEKLKNNVTQLLSTYGRAVETMKFYTTPNSVRVLPKDKERDCSETTVYLAKQVEKMIAETKSIINISN